MSEIEENILNYFGDTLNGITFIPDGFAQRSIDWLLIFRLGHVKNSTIYGDGICPLRHLISYFGDTLLSEISLTTVQSYFNSKRDLLSYETLKKHRVCLYAIFDIGREDGICTRNPVSKRISISSTVPLAVRRAWTQAEYDAVWRFARLHNAGLAVQVLMETGMSRSELLGLTWNNFDEKQHLLSITNGLVKCQNFETNKLELVHDGLKNKYRKRTVPISLELSALISKKPRKIIVRGHHIRPNFIFHAPEGGPYMPDNWYKRVLKSFMNDLNYALPEIPPLKTHELRHTRASILVNSGKNIYAVAELLGHSDLHMLRQRYLHIDLSAMRIALDLDA